jgi:hypothetical protein
MFDFQQLIVLQLLIAELATIFLAVNNLHHRNRLPADRESVVISLSPKPAAPACYAPVEPGHQDLICQKFELQIVFHAFFVLDG